MGWRSSCSVSISRFHPRTSDSWQSCFHFSCFPVNHLQVETCRSDIGSLYIDVAPHPSTGFVWRKRSLFQRPRLSASVKGSSWVWKPRLWSSEPQEKWGLCCHTPCILTDLVRIFQLGRRAVPEPLHGLHWGVAEVGWLPVHHLNHHDA